MPDALYYHVTWTTRNRSPLVDQGIAEFLCGFLRAVARQERAHILEIGMVSTHIHVLMRGSPGTDLTRLMQRLKGGSSYLAGRERRSNTGRELKWAKGYTIHSVSPRALEAVRSYLRQQPKRHPREAILGWTGDEPEYELAGGEQWAGTDPAVMGRRGPAGPSAGKPATRLSR